MIETSERMQGIACFPSLLTGPTLFDWRFRIVAKCQELETARREGGLAAVNRLIADGQRFVLTASSLTLSALLSDEEVINWLGQISQGAAGAWIREQLGPKVECDMNEGWVRRQYAPRNYPAFHAPHGWHQDGGLGFDYSAHADGVFPADAMLPMVTCWIPLDPCGIRAPGLELLKRRFDGLLAPGELKPERVADRFPPQEFWQPVMEAADAVLFRGDILHRTHVTPVMTEDRSSIELRFFPAQNLPSRLRGDRFVAMR